MVKKKIPSLPNLDWFGEHTLIRLYRGDENKYKFPALNNRRYQVAIEATYEHIKNGRRFHFGRATGRDARSDFCVSYAYTKFNFK